jgi:ADP-ribose pyrophosphatase
LPDWELLAEETVYQRRRHIVLRRYRYPDGREGDFEVLVAPEVVCVVCITVDGDVVLARQYRPGPGGWLDEIPGGAVDPGEDGATAAARELVEETGYAGDLQFVGQVFQGAYTSMRKQVFVATGATQVAVPIPEESGVVEPVVVSLDEFRAHLRSGRLTDVAAGYLALDELGLL